MYVQSKHGDLYAVDARDRTAQKVNAAYDAADNRRFYLVRATGPEAAVAFAREINACQGWLDYFRPY